MKASELDWPIVNPHSQLRHLPREVLRPAFVEQWEIAAKEVLHGASALAISARLLVRLECFLQVTNQAAPERITAANFRHVDRQFKQMLGAIYSEHFCKCSLPGRFMMASALMRCRAKIAETLHAHLTWNVPIFTTAPTAEVKRLAQLFEELELNSSLVLIWQGWPCRNKLGNVTYLPLTAVYRRLGEEFAIRLRDICVIYVGARRSLPIHGLRALSNYLEDSDDREISPSLLQQPDYATGFFFDLYEHYLRTMYHDGHGWPVATIVNTWRGAITEFFREHVFPSRLIAVPAGAFPSPRNVSTIGEPTNVRLASGDEIHEKLLTPVPLHLTDDEALELIFVTIKSDLDAAKEWAWSEVQRMAALLERRHWLASRGGVREVAFGQRRVQFPTNWEHPDHLANGAATFEHYGFPCSTDIPRLGSILPPPRARWARELVLPASGTLIPHCAVIVSEHPQITPAFLDQLELFNKNGKLIAVIPTDSGEIVSGAKMRRGPSLAAQEIGLSPRAAFALDQIIRITESARTYLRAKGNDDWRFLMLSTDRGFGEPRRASNLGKLCSNPESKKRLAESAHTALGLPKEAAAAFSRNFSIASIRASAAVVVYLETKSVQQMADTLGHARLDFHLLERYLPKPIYDFFQERWIRIFQTGIIVQVMQGSKHLLRASGLGSMDEVDAFMRAHSLKIPPLNESTIAGSENDPWAVGDLSIPKEVVFGLNEEILTVLLSLKKASEETSRQLNLKARYWVELTTALIPFVRSAADARPDIKEYLDAAELRASVTLVRDIAYAN